MAGKDKHLLVFALSRTGSLAYAHEMIRHLRSFQLRIYCAAYAAVPAPAKYMKIITYRNVFEFLINSLWVLPLLFLLICKARREAFRAAYFPVFHPWNLPLQIYCRMLGIRTYVTVHDGILHAGEDYPLVQAWQNKSIRCADELIFLSRHVAETVNQRIGFSGKAHIIPHGILRAGGDPPTRKLTVLPRLLFLGRIARYKGVDMLIEAVEGLDAHSYNYLTIAGMVVNPPAALGNPEKVRWIRGWLPEKEIIHLLNTHDILILPYTEASQSGILTLGIGAAIPMVCTRVGGLPEQLGDNEAVWTEPTAAGIRAGIEMLLSQPELYDQIHAALKRKRTNTGWGMAAELLAQIII